MNFATCRVVPEGEKRRLFALTKANLDSAIRKLEVKKKVARRLVFVDTETTGLDDEHVAVEVSWELAGSGMKGTFVPPFTPADVSAAEPVSLSINKFYERGLDKAPQDIMFTDTKRLHDALVGNTMAGSNPAFDARMLSKLFLKAGLPPRPWFYRMCDLAAYAAGVLGTDPAELLGLRDVCVRLEVEPGDHSAECDVRAVRECFNKLGVLQARRMAV
jgi:DNA polymerase-3 subunit epsilon